MPSVPDSIVHLYQWITYLTPIWGLLLVIFWNPLKNLYYKLIKKPTSDCTSRINALETQFQRIEEAIEERKDVSRALLHHEIFQTAKDALKKEYITEYELENLEELYVPYKRIGGNGTAEKLFNDCKRLPIKSVEDVMQNHE